MINKLLFLPALVALAACSQEGGSKSTPAATSVATPVFERVESLKSDARVAAVMIHADWCSSCRIFEPKLVKLKDGGPIDGVQFVTLDYTDRNKDALFARADALGVGTPVREKLKGGVTTGILLLVDMDDQKIVGDLRKELSPQELRTQIAAAASAA